MLLILMIDHTTHIGSSYTQDLVLLRRAPKYTANSFNTKEGYFKNKCIHRKLSAINKNTIFTTNIVLRERLLKQLF